MALDEIVQGKVITDLNNRKRYQPNYEIYLSKSGYSNFFFISDSSYDSFVVDPDNQVVFGGRHHISWRFQYFDNTLYLHAEHTKVGPIGWYNEAGVFYPNEVGPKLIPYKHDIAELGLWNSFYGSCNKIFEAIDSIDDEDKNRFLEQVISDLEERMAKTKDNQVNYEKSIRQFVLGLEHFANHPDEWLGYVGRGAK